jgi:hypothetical protein
MQYTLNIYTLPNLKIDISLSEKKIIIREFHINIH